jgi:hypothetical protein
VLVKGENMKLTGDIDWQDNPLYEGRKEAVDQEESLFEEMYKALKAWEFARKEGGISHADYFESAWRKTYTILCKLERRKQ